MLTHPTLDQMQALGLAGMAAAYRQLAEQDTAFAKYAHGRTSEDVRRQSDRLGGSRCGRH